MRRGGGGEPAPRLLRRARRWAAVDRRQRHELGHLNLLGDPPVDLCLRRVDAIQIRHRVQSRQKETCPDALQVYLLMTCRLGPRVIGLVPAIAATVKCNRHNLSSCVHMNMQLGAAAGHDAAGVGNETRKHSCEMCSEFLRTCSWVRRRGTMPSVLFMNRARNTDVTKGKKDVSKQPARTCSLVRRWGEVGPMQVMKRADKSSVFVSVQDNISISRYWSRTCSFVRRRGTMRPVSVMKRARKAVLRKSALATTSAVLGIVCCIPREYGEYWLVSAGAYGFRSCRFSVAMQLRFAELRKSD